jgi:hypothetical protein
MLVVLMAEGYQDRLCTYNVTLWRLCVNFIVMEMQQLVPFALLSSYEMFLTAVNSMIVPKSSCKVADIFVRF